MRSKPLSLTILVTLLLSSFAYADSPLTSTNFSNAYLNEPVVIKASKVKGKLSNELLIYLTD